MLRISNIVNILFRKTILNKRMMKFGIFSGMGLLIDLLTFYLLTESGFYIFWSNMMSSFLAITFVYCTSIRFTFENSSHSWKKFFVFVLYYTISIIVFSFFIFKIANIFNLPAIVSKAIIVPFSFLTNYYFSTKIF